MTKFSVALCGGASLLAMATSAFAQQTTTTAPAATPEIVVTGSRIIRNGYSAPTPVTVATTEDLAATTPSSIPDGLNKLPEFAGSALTSGSTNIVGGTGGGSAILNGGNYLNLRNMGEIRTLVLLDGRRVPGTAINDQVDTNTLPQMLIQRVDIVTGGASAVYGSDAVVGVVNFILDKNFNGLKVFGQEGISTYGDDRSYRFGVAAGTELFGRIHVEGSFEQYQSNGVDNKQDRPWSSPLSVYVGSGTVANPYTLIQNPRLTTSTNGGLITKGPASLVGQQFLANGQLGAFNPGLTTPTSTIQIGGDGGYQQNVALTTPLETDQGFLRADFDLTPNVKAYLQFSDAESHVDSVNGGGGTVINATIFSGNPYLPAAAQAALAGANSSFNFSKVANDLNIGSSTHQLTGNLSLTAGVTGKTFGDFVWDAYYTHGQGIVDYKTNNGIYYPNLYAALDAVNGPNGPVCRVSTTAYASLYPGCAPLNLFGAGNESAQALAFIRRNTEWDAVSLLDDFAASVSGDAFNDWAGPVSVAANVEYRAQSLQESSPNDPLIQVPQINYNTSGSTPVPVSYVGLTPEAAGVPIPASAYSASVQSKQYGSESVWEVSGETVVPLLKDMIFAKSADVSAAVRYTDYSTSGPAVTWKVGLNYQPVEDLRIRVTESRDIRAPTLFDLYAAKGISQIGLSDPLTGVSQPVNQYTGGNPNLVPEVSYTTTAGFVYSPSWLPRFRMSLDYYNMNMTNVITSTNGSNSAIIGQCDASGGTSPVCAAIVRPFPISNTTAANFPTYITNYSINAATAYTHGIDIEASYNFMLADVIKNAPGRFDLRLLEAYQPVLILQNYPGAPLTSLIGVAGASASRLTTTADYQIGPFSLEWEMRYLSSQNRGGSITTVYAQPPLPGIFYHDLNATYRFKADGHDMQLYVVVDNLLNQPARVSPLTNFTGNPGGNSANILGDDPIGRYFTLGFRAQY